MKTWILESPLVPQSNLVETVGDELSDVYAL